MAVETAPATLLGRRLQMAAAHPAWHAYSQPHRIHHRQFQEAQEGKGPAAAVSVSWSMTDQQYGSHGYAWLKLVTLM